MFSKLIDLPSYLIVKLAINLRHLQIDNYELILVIITLLCMISTVVYKVGTNKIDSQNPVMKISSFFKSFTVVVLFVLILRSVFYVPFSVTQSDLTPEISDNSKVIVDRISLGIRLPLTGRFISFREPQRFEIIKVRLLSDIEGQPKIRHLFGRTMGFAGDKIVLEPNSTHATITSVDGNQTSYDFKASGYTSAKRIEITVPDQKIFIMTNSYDLPSLQEPLFIDTADVVGVIGFVF